MHENSVLPDPDDDETVIVGADESTLVIRRGTPPEAPDERTASVREPDVPAPDDLDDLDESTVSVREPDAPAADDLDDLDESTLSVRDGEVDDRSDVDDSTVIVSPVEPDDSTVIVREPGSEPEPRLARSARAVAVTAAAGTADDASTTAEETPGVEHSSRSATSDEATIRLSRSTPPAVRPAMTPRPGRRRGELRPAPVPSGFGGLPLVASGPGTVSTYGTRTLTPPSPTLLTPAIVPVPDRALDRQPSVRTQSRSIAFWTLAAAAVSVVLIGGGIWWALRDLIGF